MSAARDCVIGYYNRVDTPGGCARVTAYHGADVVEVVVYHGRQWVATHRILKRDAPLVGEALRQYTDAELPPPEALRREVIA